MAELISMTYFVLEQKETETFDTSQIMWYDKEVDKLVKIRNYANFLKQLLEIWMFVPCKLVDGVWVVLEEPDADYYKMVTEQDLKEYEQAKSLCLFEGFEYSDIGYWYINTQENGMLMFDEENIENQTIEDLVKYKLTLTPAAEKQI